MAYLQVSPLGASRGETWRVLKWLCACVRATYDSISSQFFAQKELSYRLSENRGCSMCDAANELGKPMLRWNYRGARQVYVSTIASYIEGHVLNVVHSARITVFRPENKKKCLP
jgi:hypothetical protein